LASSRAFLGHVAIGDKNVFEPFLRGKDPGIAAELKKDRGLGVGVGDGAGLGFLRGFHDLLGFYFLAHNAAAVFPGELGDLVVLTEVAAEVAAHRGDGEGSCSGKEMEEGFFLHGIEGLGDEAAVHQGIELSAAVFPDHADPPAAGRDEAAVGAESAAHPALARFLPKHRLLHGTPMLFLLPPSAKFLDIRHFLLTPVSLSPYNAG
jgi:hypothetical protein